MRICLSLPYCSTRYLVIFLIKLVMCLREFMEDDVHVNAYKMPTLGRTGSNHITALVILALTPPNLFLFHQRLQLCVQCLHVRRAAHPIVQHFQFHLDTPRIVLPKSIEHIMSGSPIDQMIQLPLAHLATIIYSVDVVRRRGHSQKHVDVGTSAV